MTLWKSQIVSALPIAFLGYAIALSLAKTFSYKNEYSINPMQEAFSLGIANSFGSLFNTIPGTASLSRSSLQVLNFALLPIGHGATKLLLRTT